MGTAEGSIRGGISPGTRVGDYEVGALLAQGGMGRVFSAIHRETGQKLAIKTLLSREPELVEYFRREIKTLSALDHPAVVPFRAHGVLHGEPWYAMDLLEGATLRHAVGHRPGAPLEDQPPSGLRLALTAEQLIEVCIKVLRALEHVHGQGVVHGDIKPENIFLCAEDRPVLVDFGVAASFDLPRERLELMPRSIGSVAYMAPELLRGGMPDARADLYAMGCILYECLTGRHPFLRGSIEATKLAHLRADALPPSQFCPSIPRHWEGLILRLLAKSPGDRPGYARDALEVLTGSAGGVELAEPARPSGYLYRAPLVGRGEPLQLLQERLARAATGEGARVLVRGDTGMGKTRLVLELVQRALQTDAAVLYVECTAPEEQQTRPWLQPLATLIRNIEDQFAELAERGGKNELEATRGALELLRDAEPGATERRAAAREDLVQGLVTGVLAVSTERLTLVAVDNLEHADEVTREFVRRLAAVCPGRRLVFVCTEGTRSAVEPAASDPFEVLSLRPLGEADVDAAVRSMLALEHPSPSLIDRAYQISQGNPFILGTYLRTLIDTRVLKRDRHRGWHVVWPRDSLETGAEAGEAAGIASVRALFEWRLRGLSKAELDLGSVAALLSTSFDAVTLAGVAQAPLGQVEAALGELTRNQVVERLAADGRYRVSHITLNHLLRSRLGTDETRRIHRRAAALLRSQHALSQAAPGALALHLAACGSHRKAASFFAEAGRWYLQAHRRTQALESFASAIAELGLCRSAASRYQAELFELHEALGDVAVSLREYAKATKAYESALAFAGADPIRSARQYRKLAAAQQRDRKKAMECLERATALLAAAADEGSEFRFEWIQVHLDTMWVHYWKQETRAVLAIADRIAPEVQAFGNARQQASFAFNLAVGMMQQNRYVTGLTELSHVERALAIYDGLGDRPNVAMCRFVRSMVLLFAGDLDAAELGFEAVLRISEKATSVTIRVRALTFLCILERKRRDSSRVRKLATAALSLATEHDMPEYRGTAMANLAWVAYQDGEFAECERLVRAAIAAWDASPLNVFRWTGLFPLIGAILARSPQDSDPAELAELASGLLHDSQQQLPEPLAAGVAELEQARSQTDEAARDAGRRVLELAVRYAFM
jgi:hypothetical protein